MRLSLAYSLLVQQELRNKNRFDALATAMELLMEEDEETVSVVDLTMMKDGESVAEFVDLTKDPEVYDLCSSSSSSAGGVSATSSSDSSNLKPRGLLQEECGVTGFSTDSDISSGGTGGHQGLPHPKLIGTLIKFRKSKLPERQQEASFDDGVMVPSVLFFLSCSGGTGDI